MSYSMNPALVQHALSARWPRVNGTASRAKSKIPVRAGLEVTVDRRVTATKKDASGKITALCNAGQSWSPRRTADVIKDIQNAKKSYYVEEGPRRAYLRVVSHDRLQTTDDTTSKNNLESLPVG